MSKNELPPPTVVVPLEGHKHMTPEMVRAILCNPFYTGIAPFQAMVTDEQWIEAAAKMIREDGATQFLVNLLHVLKVTMHNLATGSK